MSSRLPRSPPPATAGCGWPPARSICGCRSALPTFRKAPSSAYVWHRAVMAPRKAPLSSLVPCGTSLTSPCCNGSHRTLAWPAAYGLRSKASPTPSPRPFRIRPVRRRFPTVRLPISRPSSSSGIRSIRSRSGSSRSNRAAGQCRSEADQPLTIDVTFGRLGRVRLELRAHGRGELALSLRSEMALPAEARDRLRDVVGAAFELGGRPAWFMVLTGPIPSGPRGAGFPA